jgi:hypothetical protein
MHSGSREVGFPGIEERDDEDVMMNSIHVDHVKRQHWALHRQRQQQYQQRKKRLEVQQTKKAVTAVQEQRQQEREVLARTKQADQLSREKQRLKDLKTVRVLARQDYVRKQEWYQATKVHGDEDPGLGESTGAASTEKRALTLGEMEASSRRPSDAVPETREGWADESADGKGGSKRQSSKTAGKQQEAQQPQQRMTHEQQRREQQQRELQKTKLLKEKQRVARENHKRDHESKLKHEQAALGQTQGHQQRQTQQHHHQHHHRQQQLLQRRQQQEESRREKERLQAPPLDPADPMQDLQQPADSPLEQHKHFLHHTHSLSYMPLIGQEGDRAGTSACLHIDMHRDSATNLAKRDNRELGTNVHCGKFTNARRFKKDGLGELKADQMAADGDKAGAKGAKDSVGAGAMDEEAALQGAMHQLAGPASGRAGGGRDGPGGDRGGRHFATTVGNRSKNHVVLRKEPAWEFSPTPRFARVREQDVTDLTYSSSERDRKAWDKSVYLDAKNQRRPMRGCGASISVDELFEDGSDRLDHSAGSLSLWNAVQVSPYRMAAALASGVERFPEKKVIGPGPGVYGQKRWPATRQKSLNVTYGPGSDYGQYD